MRLSLPVLFPVNLPFRFTVYLLLCPPVCFPTWLPFGFPICFPVVFVAVFLSGPQRLATGSPKRTQEAQTNPPRHGGHSAHPLENKVAPPKEKRETLSLAQVSLGSGPFGSVIPKAWHIDEN